jgi:serine/threonine-protein phosphatase 5
MRGPVLLSHFFFASDQIGNKGAYIVFKADCKPDIRQFDSVPHPRVPPMAYGSPYGM